MSYQPTHIDMVENTVSQFGIQHLSALGERQMDMVQTTVPEPTSFRPGYEFTAKGRLRVGDGVVGGGLCTVLLVGTGSLPGNRSGSLSNQPAGGAAAGAHGESSSAVTFGDCSHCIATIRTAFPLQISQIAEILGVSRPTIYAWISEGQRPQPRCRARLNQVYALAEFWNKKSNLPLPAQALTSPDETGTSLLEMLKAEKIDFPAARTRLNCLQIAARRNIRVPSIADLARKYGINLESNTENVGEFDVVTRRPMNEA